MENSDRKIDEDEVKTPRRKWAAERWAENGFFARWQREHQLGKPENPEEEEDDDDEEEDDSDESSAGKLFKNSKSLGAGLLKFLGEKNRDTPGKERRSIFSPDTKTLEDENKTSELKEPSEVGIETDVEVPELDADIEQSDTTDEMEPVETSDFNLSLTPELTNTSSEDEEDGEPEDSSLTVASVKGSARASSGTSSTGGAIVSGGASGIATASTAGSRSGSAGLGGGGTGGGAGGGRGTPPLPPIGGGGGFSGPGGPGSPSILTGPGTPNVLAAPVVAERIIERRNGRLAALALLATGAEFLGRRRAVNRLEKADDKLAKKNEQLKKDVERLSLEKMLDKARAVEREKQLEQRVVERQKSKEVPKIISRPEAQKAPIRDKQPERPAPEAKRSIETPPVRNPETVRPAAVEQTEFNTVYERSPELRIPQEEASDQPVEKLYEMRHEAKDDDAALIAANAASVGAILAHQRGATAIQAAIATDIAKISAKSRQQTDKQLYATAAKTGVAGAVVIIVLGVIAYLVLSAIR